MPTSEPALGLAQTQDHMWDPEQLLRRLSIVPLEAVTADSPAAPCPAAGPAAVAAGSLLPLHVVKMLQVPRRCRCPATCSRAPALALQALLQSQQAALGPLLPVIQQGLQPRSSTPPGGTPAPKGRTQTQQDAGGGLQPVLLLVDPVLEGLPLEALQASTALPAPGRAAQLAGPHCNISACIALLQQDAALLPGMSRLLWRASLHHLSPARLVPAGTAAGSSGQGLLPACAAQQAAVTRRPAGEVPPQQREATSS